MYPLLLCLLLSTPADDRPDVLLADFEGADYAGWTAEGEAFGDAPARGTLPNQMPVGGFVGSGLVNSFRDGDRTTGTLTSTEFRVERRRINFLVGGGRQPDELAVELLVGGRAVRSETGHDSEHLRPASWDVAEFEGRAARIRIVDRATGGWGHINADHFVQSDAEPVVPDERATLLARAEASVAEAVARVKDDPSRPTFHVLAPANWINDPNGPIFHDGWYHLFYQHNPYGDDWGNMHWGHVRSRDLARWEHQPIALWPSKAAGEDHVFSGSARIGPDGKPMIFYTSIGPRLPEQWAAVPEDDGLVRWKKHPANPILTEAVHGDTKVHEWRDPFLFEVGGKAHMVLGGNLNAGKGGEAVVMAYRAKDEELTDWESTGVLFRHPDPEVKNIECPLFFPLDGKWVLIVSQGKPVDWFVGDLDEATMRFTPTTRGKLDHGQVYAPNVLLNDPKGRVILWGWVDGYPPGQGWRHCMTLPRVLSIGPDGTLRQAPAPELAALRSDGMVGPEGLWSAFEVVAEPALGPAGSAAIDLFEPRGAEAVAVEIDRDAIRFGGVSVPRHPADGEAPDRVRVFVDHGLVEVYADDGRYCHARVFPPPSGPSRPRLAVERGGPGRLESWPLQSIWARDFGAVEVKPAPAR